MNILEDRVRAALSAHAEDFSAHPDAWARIQCRSRAAGKRRAAARWSRPGRFLIPAAAATAVVAIVAAALALSDTFGRATGAPAGAGSTSPAAPAMSPGPVTTPPRAVAGLQVTPVSAILALPVTDPQTGQTAVAYSWLGHTSPYAWMVRWPGLQVCADVVYPGGDSEGGCNAVPRLDAGRPAVVTASDGSQLDGPLVLQGLAISRVASVTAVLPDGEHIPGVVTTGRGFTGKAWAVAVATDKFYNPVSGERMVFRDAAGHEIASLGMTPAETPAVTRPASGGILTLKSPCCRTAYLIDGYVGFFYGRTGWMAPQLAAGPPALAGLATNIDEVWEAFGYSHTNVTRVVLDLGGGRKVATPTFTAWPGSGLRLWAIRLPGQPKLNNPDLFPIPDVTATGYDAAGHAVTQLRLGVEG